MGEPNARDRIDAMMECMGLDDPDRTWAALVDQQLVGNRRSVREAFERAVRRAWTADGYPPNAAHDVAERVRRAGATPSGLSPDPDEGWAQAVASGYRDNPPEVEEPASGPPIDRVHCRTCGTLTSARPSAVGSCESCGNPPLDLIELAVAVGLSTQTVQLCDRCLTSCTFTAAHCYFCGDAL